MTLEDPVVAVAESAGLNLPALDQASVTTEQQLARFRDDLDESLSETPGIGVVLTGSFARGEVVPDSDCDFLVIVTEVAEPHHVPRTVHAMKTLVEEHEYEPPGDQGVFGDFALAAELMARIGLDGDSNTNLTRRILLLFESVAVFGDGALETARDLLLVRYCYDYHPEVRAKDTLPSTARFLLNDLVRYWRTVTVDFGAKRWRSARRDWYLRYAKLLTTRKILFAGSLFSVLTIEQAMRESDPARVFDDLLDHLRRQLQFTPLGRLMSGYDALQPQGQQALVGILENYERFVALISDKETRDALKDVGDDGYAELRTTVEEIGANIEQGLEQIFFDDPLLAGQTRKYGLF